MMDQARILELLNNFVEYCEELKERETIEDKKIFYFDIIGMNEEELNFFDIKIEE